MSINIEVFINLCQLLSNTREKIERRLRLFLRTGFTEHIPEPKGLISSTGHYRLAVGRHGLQFK